MSSPQATSASALAPKPGTTSASLNNKLLAAIKAAGQASLENNAADRAIRLTEVATLINDGASPLAGFVFALQGTGQVKTVAVAIAVMFADEEVYQLLMSNIKSKSSQQLGGVLSHLNFIMESLDRSGVTTYPLTNPVHRIRRDEVVKAIETDVAALPKPAGPPSGPGATAAPSAAGVGGAPKVLVPQGAEDSRVEAFLAAIANGECKMVEDFLVKPEAPYPIMDPKLRTKDGRSAVGVAIKYSRPEVLRLLIDGPITDGALNVNFRGADVNTPLPDGGHPLNAAVAALPKPGAAEMVRYLLSRNAGMEWDRTTWDQLLGEVTKKAGAGVLTAQYWIEVARDAEKPTKEQLMAWRASQMDRMSALTFSMVGQGAGKIMAKYTVLSWESMMHKIHDRPLTLLLAGPPGHGKTAFFKSLCDAMKLPPSDMLQVDIGNISSTAEFMCMASVWARGGPTRLDDFLVAHDGKRGLVIFDEIEKPLMSGNSHAYPIYDAMYPIFETGRVTVNQNSVDSDQAKRTQPRAVDVSHIVFMATTNWGQDEILKWFEEKKASRTSKSMMSADDKEKDLNERAAVEKVRREVQEADFGADFEAIKAELKAIDDAQAEPNRLTAEDEVRTLRQAQPVVMGVGEKVREVVRKNLGQVGKDALASRFDFVLPFVPFEESEKLVVAEQMLQELVISTAAKASVPNSTIQYGLDVRYGRDVIEYCAKGYSPLDGARSIRRKINEINVCITDIFMRSALPALYQQSAEPAKPCGLMLKQDPVTKLIFAEPKSWAADDAADGGAAAAESGHSA